MSDGPVVIIRVPPVAARLQREVARKGPLSKAICRDRRQPVIAQVVILIAWSLRRLSGEWLDVSRDGTPHFDLWGSGWRWAR